MEKKHSGFDAATFLAPSALKVALMITLLLISSFLYAPEKCAGKDSTSFCFKRLGFPMGIYALYNESDTPVGKDLNNLNKGFLLGAAVDVVFWYVIACILEYAYVRYGGNGKIKEAE